MSKMKLNQGVVATTATTPTPREAARASLTRLTRSVATLLAQCDTGAPDQGEDYNHCARMLAWVLSDGAVNSALIDLGLALIGLSQAQAKRGEIYASPRDLPTRVADYIDPDRLGEVHRAAALGAECLALAPALGTPITEGEWTYHCANDALWGDA